MGTENYVTPILNYLNKEYKEEYFETSKIIARDSQINNLTHKSINKIFPSNHDFCIILDDRTDVWLEYDAVIKIFPYWHFVDSPCGSIKRNHLNEDCFLELSSIIMIYLWDVFFKVMSFNKTLSVQVRLYLL